MGFWLFMFIMAILIPLIMILGGRLFTAKPPKNINFFYGYRTAMSMKNIDTWIFAHKHCGRIWFRAGLVMLPLSAAMMVLLTGEDIDTVGIWGAILCVIQMLVLIISIIPTERALKNKFDKDGNPR